MKKSSKLGMWQYLESTEGLLERGNEMEIKEAKKAFRKKYLTEYKRKQREQRDEFMIDFAKDSMDYGMITEGAKRHNLSIPALLRSATLAYLKKTYLVPNKAQLTQIQMLLSECQNEINSIARRTERYQFDEEEKIEQIGKRIEKLEKEINECICYPLPVEEYLKKAVVKDPTLKEQLLIILNLSFPDDTKNKVA